ncbi:hypothetical protein [Sphingomonas sp. RB3P16]|uniref:hypothetical protein n=1 Tax=Parasphingomonas frigoris TaxID=3096163 RepID=UPI002FC70738
MDLVRLRDIGPVDPTQQYVGLFTVSPEGQRAAFQLRLVAPRPTASAWRCWWSSSAQGEEYSWLTVVAALALVSQRQCVTAELS